MADPEGGVNQVLAELGLAAVPEGVRIHVVEDTADEVYLVLPARARVPARRGDVDNALCSVLASVSDPSEDATDVNNGCTTPTATVGCYNTDQEQCTTPTYSEESCPANTEGGCETDDCETAACDTDDACDKLLAAPQRPNRRFELALF